LHTLLQGKGNVKVLCEACPHLFSFTTNESITLQAVLEVNDLNDLFQLPLAEEAYTQFCELQIYLQAIQGSHELDKWKYVWGSGQYRAEKAYKTIIGSQPIHPAYKWIWQSACQQKHKVFYWLLLKNMLNTWGMLRRRNMQLESYDCEFYLLQRVEVRRHLFYKCSFAKNCWAQIRVNVPTWLKPARATKHIKRILRVLFAMEIIIIMC
jgi:hypothetical protein